MKVIIAGGSGFLGRRLSTSFVNDGHAVTIVSRNPGNLKTQKSQISFVSWNDLQDSVGRQNIAEADVIINLAGKILVENDGRRNKNKIAFQSD